MGRCLYTEWLIIISSVFMIIIIISSVYIIIRIISIIIQVEQLLAAMRMEEKADVQCGKLSEVSVNLQCKEYSAHDC